MRWRGAVGGRQPAGHPVDRAFRDRYTVRMDWLWPLYRQYVTRELGSSGVEPSDAAQRTAFLATLAGSTATLYVMEPVGDTIRFRGLGRWPLPDVPELLADPNAFIADRFGGGKYKVNFHHGATFVCTHNFRTTGDQRWRDLEEVIFD